MTGSLGILAKAAYTGFDLVAAGVSYFAIRLSGRPADAEHFYSYDKVGKPVTLQVDNLARVIIRTEPDRQENS